MTQKIELEEWAKGNPGKPAPEADRYRIRVGDEGGFDQKLVIKDPKPTGRQILEAAGRLPAEEHMLLLLQSDGMLEEVNLGETVDLRRPGAERFLVFRSDRVLYFELDGRRFPWGTDKISEATLRKLGRVPQDYNIWLERRGKEDLLLERGRAVDLSPAGLERFYSGKDETRAGRGESVLPKADLRYLEEHGIAFEEVSDGERKGIVFKGCALPETLDAAAADILVILPSSYSDAGPDMFHTDPWVKLRASGKYPEAADQAVDFVGRRWQRWSRHNNEWRAGVDGIWTMLRRIDAALKGAR